MNDVNFHLAYLLSKHECVIIPGFGAFISHPESAEKDKSANFWTSPIQYCIFNPHIRNNDGLLANSIATERNITYKEALLIIEQYSCKLNHDLSLGKTIHLPWIGEFILNSNNSIQFTSSHQISCNSAYYGLSNFYLSPLSGLIKDNIDTEGAKEQPSIERYSFRWPNAIAATAAVAALFFLSIPLNDNSFKSLTSTSNASIISLPTTQTPPQIEYEKKTLTIDSITTPILEKEVVKPINSRYYYIIIASLPTKDLAEKKVEEYHNDGFSEAAIISKDDKHRVYVNKFEDKTEAEAFLSQFRTDYPRHSKAWLLAQKG